MAHRRKRRFITCDAMHDAVRVQTRREKPGIEVHVLLAAVQRASAGMASGRTTRERPVHHCPSQLKGAAALDPGELAARSIAQCNATPAGGERRAFPPSRRRSPTTRRAHSPATVARAIGSPEAYRLTGAERQRAPACRGFQPARSGGQRHHDLHSFNECPRCEIWTRKKTIERPVM